MALLLHQTTAMTVKFRVRVPGSCWISISIIAAVLLVAGVSFCLFDDDHSGRVDSDNHHAEEDRAVLNWKIVTKSLSSFVAISFVLCVGYGLVAPSALHAAWLL